MKNSRCAHRKQPLGGVLKNRCSDGMSLLGISDLFWKILGSWENLRCSGEISAPGKTELFLRNFCSPVKSELFLWKFPSFLCEKQKPPVKNWSVLVLFHLPGKNAPVLVLSQLPVKFICSEKISACLASWEKRTCSEDDSASWQSLSCSGNVTSSWENVNSSLLGNP